MAQNTMATVSVREVSKDDIELGPHLGTGSFNNVYRAASSLLSSAHTDTNENSRTHVHLQRENYFVTKRGATSLSRLSSNNNGGSSRSITIPNDATPDDASVESQEQNQQFQQYKRQFAIKRLHEDTLKSDEKALREAEEDLLLEAQILSKISHLHKHIITLHAVSEGFFQSPRKGFLVLDCMAGTLSDRLRRWKLQNKRVRENLNYHNRNHMSPLERAAMVFQPHRARQERNEALRSEQSSRVSQVGLGVAKALDFLHKQGILY